MSTPLDPARIDHALEHLPGWRHDGGTLVKTFTFGSFPEALSFMMRIGFEAEAMNHHPEWTNVYNRVTVRLTTHDAGDRLTEKDLTLAQTMERINWSG